MRIRYPFISVIGSSIIGALFANFIFVLHWRVLALLPASIFLIFLFIKIQLWYWHRGGNI